MNRETVIRWICGVVGFGILGFFVLLFTFIAFYRWDSRVNKGHEYGYYGEVNAVSNALVRMDGVDIVECFINLDMFVEEFGFKVADQEGREFWISFGEEDPARHLRGKELDAALADIAAQEPPGNEQIQQRENDL